MNKHSKSRNFLRNPYSSPYGNPGGPHPAGYERARADCKCPERSPEPQNFERPTNLGGGAGVRASNN